MKIHILGDGTEYHRVDGNKNKKTIVIEEAALDTLKAMVEQLQEERDELLNILEEGNGLLLAVDQIQVNSPFHRAMKSVIAKCTATPEVM